MSQRAASFAQPAPLWRRLARKANKKLKVAKVFHWLEDRLGGRWYRWLRRFQDWYYFRVLREYPVASFRRLTLPLVRRVYPQLIAEAILTPPLLTEGGLRYYERYCQPPAPDAIPGDDRPDIYSHGL